MSAQYDDYIDEDEGGTTSESADHSDEQYELEGDQAIGSDEEIQYNDPRPRWTVQPKSPVFPSGPMLMKMTKKSTPATRKDPVNEKSESGNKNAGASAKSAMVVPKKRPYGPVETSNSAKKTSASEKTSVSETKSPVEEVDNVSQIKEFRLKPTVARKKSLKIVSEQCPSVDPVAKSTSAKKTSASKTSSNPTTKNPVTKVNTVLQIEDSLNKPEVAMKKSPVKKGRQDAKTHPKKLVPPQSTNEAPSTSFAVEDKVDCVTMIPQMNDPGPNKISKVHYFKKRRLWDQILASNFQSVEYEKLLKKSKFTAEQTDVLKHSFHELFRKIYIATTFTDRFMKTHSCMDCQFFISHQCLSIHFSQYVRSNGNVVGITRIPPESMNICICGFGFFHSHDKKSRGYPLNDVTASDFRHLLEHDRSVTVSCITCDMNITMKNRYIDVCCSFTSWVNFDGVRNRKFYAFLDERLGLSAMDKPRRQELYTCNRRCCQIFHRCPEKAVSDNTNKPQLSPITTYTSTVICSSRE